jgi:hypothetical protein
MLIYIQTMRRLLGVRRISALVDFLLSGATEFLIDFKNLRIYLRMNGKFLIAVSCIQPRDYSTIAG